VGKRSYVEGLTLYKLNVNDTTGGATVTYYVQRALAAVEEENINFDFEFIEAEDIKSEQNEFVFDDSALMYSG